MLMVYLAFTGKERINPIEAFWGDVNESAWEK